MKTVGAFEAKTHFSQLLERAEKGEEILITRRGKPVARLVPVSKFKSPEDAKKALLELRERAKAAGYGPFNWEEWKAYRDEGKR